MRRMYSENQLIKLIEEHGGGTGAVNSVNSKTGTVVLDATDIKLTTNQQTIQNNFIRVDGVLDQHAEDIDTAQADIAGINEVLDGFVDRFNDIEADLEDKADTLYVDTELDGKLDVPTSAHPTDCLLGIDPDNAPLTITVGSGLTLSNGQLSATGGGGGGSDVYVHNVQLSNDSVMSNVLFSYYSSRSASLTSITELAADILNKVGVIYHGEGMFGQNGLAIGNVVREGSTSVHITYINTNNEMESIVLDDSDGYTIADSAQPV